MKNHACPCYLDKGIFTFYWPALVYHSAVAFASQNSLTFFNNPGPFFFCLAFRFCLRYMISLSLVKKSNTHTEVEMRMVIVSLLISLLPSPKSYVNW